ncbi:unnamed protein product [Absidia cylindrospora]
MNDLLSNPAGQELRSTDRPMYGMASTNVNDTIYMYGGFYGVSPWNMEALWTMPSTVEPKYLTQVKTDPTASPVLIYTQLLYYPRNDCLYAFGGHHPPIADRGIEMSSNLTLPNNNNSSSSSTATNTTPISTPALEPLRYYRYDISLKTWTPLKPAVPNNNTNGPLERYWHTATIDANATSAYLFGGMNITGSVNDFWRYAFESNTWQPLTLPSTSWQARCGHSSNMLSNGMLVILGGYHCVGNYTTNPVMPKVLVPLDHATVYNTMTQAWTNQSLSGLVVPEPRAYHSAITTKDDRLMICGGQDGAAQPFQTYISAGGDPSAMTAVLDTMHWEWLVPTPSPYQPFPRSFASAVLVNDSKVMIGFGINYHTIYDGMYVFDVADGKWLPASPNALKPMAGQIAFIAGMAVMGSFVGAILLVGLCLIVKKLQRRVVDFAKKVKNDIWNPRAGEPMWAEMSRLLFRIMFLAVFLTVVGVLILQVRNSPIIDQKYYVHNSDYTVDVPDIRFCFDGWTSDNSVTSPYIQCATDFGDSCSQYLIDISKNVETGLNYYGTTLHCYLFRAPPSFRLGRTNDRIISNGSYLKFYYYGDRLPSTASHLHLVFYNKYHNPNLPVYHINDPYDLPFSWYSDSEDAQFQSAEEENLRTENSFDLNPNVGSTSSFATIEREEIKSTNFWNYVGIASVHKRAYEIESKAVSETVTTIYATEPQPLGSLHVFPANYEVTVLREQRAFTVVNAMGIIGGIFGLIVGLQACLFGYRPRSPMGLIHRWGMGQMRWSISQGLLASRIESIHHSPVPLVNPVHRRFSHFDAKPPPPHLSHHPPMHEDDDTYFPPTTTTTATAVTTTPGENEETRRLTRMEERLQLMELLFKSYYINDEVFQSLDKAIKKEEVKKLATYDDGSPNTSPPPPPLLAQPPTPPSNDSSLSNTATNISNSHHRHRHHKSSSTSSASNHLKRHFSKRWLSAFRGTSNDTTTGSNTMWSLDASSPTSESHPLPSLANPTRDFVPPTSSPSPTMP